LLKTNTLGFYVRYSQKKILSRIVMIIVVSLFLVSFTSYSFAQTSEKLVVLETNLGSITIEFFSNDAPNHIDNFIGLTESGFYDGTIFHRIIPGFMIQGGDPNTISGDPNTWGTGGPSTSVDAEFNSIKHNRGIVSMARSADPNSGGSQFFIVHKDSNFLDEQYTVFGRIVTEESFQTLDKIISVEIGSSDRPIDPEQVKITKATVVNRSEVSNLLTQSEPERTLSPITPSTGNQKFENSEYGISLSFPEGWLLQQPDKTQVNSPDVVAVGPQVGAINPQITLTIHPTNQKTIDDLIIENKENLNNSVEAGTLKLNSQEKTIVNGYPAHITNAEQEVTINDIILNVKFKEILIYDLEKFYILTYGNDIIDFDSQLPRFDETINSFEISSKESTLNESPIKEGGGCLIATATYGSEMAPQVQQLREFRDNTILQTESGSIFMSGFNQFYYSFSPVIANLERENPIFKEVVKLTLTPMLSSLSLLNYVDIDSEQEMLGYGISLIILNTGMYFVAPAIIIYKIRK
jgi:peptidyl-prolyl cis-trans isomerase B (cyclophilin B)